MSTRHSELDSESINVYLSRKGRTLREKWIDSGSESGMTQNCHAELVSASIHSGNEGSPLTPTLPRRARGNKAAFTLAEVLITLAIIGVVAALTIPTTIQNYKKRHVPTALLKFYSTFNQAIHLSEVDNGHIDTWSNVDVGYNAESMKDWWDKYMANYYKTAGHESLNNWLLFQGMDGTAFAMASCKDYPYATSCIHVKFCTNFKTCRDEAEAMSFEWGTPTDGKNSFMFYLTSKGLTTWGFNANGERNNMIYSKNPSNNSACGGEYKWGKNGNCSALIERDGWKIADDYPIKF